MKQVGDQEHLKMIFKTEHGYSRERKVDNIEADVVSEDILFHTRLPAISNVRSPTARSLNLRTTGATDDDERNIDVRKQ